MTKRRGDVNDTISSADAHEDGDAFGSKRRNHQNKTLKPTSIKSLVTDNNTHPPEAYETLTTPLESIQEDEGLTFEYGDPIHNEKYIRIAVIGAGPSGLLFAYKLQRSFRKFSLTLYDKNPEISGTWFENRYPGCACDIPAHNYTYTFEPKSDWSTIYAGAEEIRGYFNDFSHKHDLQKYIKTSCEVIHARWIEDTGTWNLDVKSLASGKVFSDECNILINAGGYLNNPAWPRIPGLQSFQGRLLHSANWDSSVSLRSKRVGLMGNGSSGVQILPALQHIASSVTIFMRSPTWILPPVGDAQHAYTKEELENYLRNPKALTALRKTNERIVNSFFSLYLQNSPLQNDIKEEVKKGMKQRLPSHIPEAKAFPEWGVGCRRLTAGPGYLEALAQNNVKAVHSGVTALTEHGCVDEDGTEHLVEVVICATGFNTSYIPRFPIIGTSGLNMQDAWAQQPRSYMGVAVPGFSNYLTLLGPYSPTANGPTIPGLEAQADYILVLIDRYQTENIHSFMPKAVAVDDFMAHHAAFMRKTVWSQGCRSGHKQHTSSGKVPQLWPGSSLHCIEALKTLRADDWEFSYKGNRFDWLGNGLSQTEMDPQSDLGYYIRERDDGEFASVWRRREVLTNSGCQPKRELFKVQRGG